jgi:hypothetical protein
LRPNQVLFVALAMVYDEKLRKFSRNPYFSSMDVTHGTNREKRDELFITCLDSSNKYIQLLEHFCQVAQGGHSSGL